MSAVEQQRSVAHPLDPLSAAEIERAAEVLRGDCGLDDRWRFGSIELHEPSTRSNTR